MSASVPKGSLLRYFVSPSMATVVFAIAVTVGIWTIAAWRIDSDREGLYATAQNELLGSQGIVAAQVGRTVESAQSLIEAVDIWLSEQEIYSNIDDLGRIVDRLQRRHQLPINIGLFNEAGDMIPFGQYGVEGLNVADREYITAVQGTWPGTIHIGRQILTRNVGQWSIPVVMRARANSFGVRYILTAIPVAPFEEIFASIFVTAPAVVGVVRDDGALLLRSPDATSLVARRTSFDLDALIGPAGKRADTGVIRVSIFKDSPEVMVAYKRLETQPLFVYASFRIMDLETTLAARAKWTLGIAIAATLATLVMAGSIIGFMGLHEREADRVRAALTEAEAANTAKREFLANVSHELRTPLNAIIGFSEFVVMQTFGPIHDRYKGYLGDVLSAGKHLLGVVDQLLDLAAIEARRMIVRPERLDPGAVVRDVADMIRPIATERHVAVILRPPTEPVLTVNDPGAVRQILVNLVGNAVKFCRPNGTVEIAWRRDIGGAVVIAVADEGDGIEPSDLENIFEPFWRKESAYVRRQGGTGLGLSLTRQLVERLDGKIEVESEPGKGSRFTVRLPEQKIAGAEGRAAA